MRVRIQDQGVTQERANAPEGARLRAQNVQWGANGWSAASPGIEPRPSSLSAQGGQGELRAFAPASLHGTQHGGGGSQCDHERCREVGG
jgi:hypothetical protein